MLWRPFIMLFVGRIFWLTSIFSPVGHALNSSNLFVLFAVVVVHDFTVAVAIAVYVAIYRVKFRA